MGFLKNLLGGGNKAKSDPLGGKPPMYGGDGSSPSKAVVVNCASMGTANHLIERFIAERHGEKGSGWNPGFEMFVNAPGITEYTMRSVSIQDSGKKSHSYYFDLTRPMNATKEVMKMAGAWPKDAG